MKNEVQSSLTEEQIRDKIRGAMIGGAVGDALGYQIEFQQGVAPKMATRFFGKVGVISDDTQMTLFTACGLLWRETRWHLRGMAMLPAEAIYLAYLDWLGTQQRVDEHTAVSWIRDLPALNTLRDPGMTCIEALSAGQPGTLGVPINESKGSGGVMRIAPIALYLNEAAIGEVAAKSCALTHGHPLAVLSAYVLGYVIYYAYAGKPVKEAVETALAKMDAWVAEGVNSAQKLVKMRYEAEKAELTTLFQRALKLAQTETEDQAAICQLGAGWVAEEAVAIAIYCAAKYQDSFEDAIVAAANHDGDSDSTAAITGNIVGARLGYEKIPEYYRDKVELKEVILELADDLASGVRLDENGEIIAEWQKKYLHLEQNLI